MKPKKVSLLFFVLLIALSPLASQQFNSVPLDNQSYNVIDLAIMRGLVKAPSSARPWSEYTVKQKLTELLDAAPGALSSVEQDIVSDLLAAFERKNGLDLFAGRFHNEYPLKSTRYSVEAGLTWESNFSFNPVEKAVGTVNLGNLYTAGDLGNNFSWNFIIKGGFFKIDRKYLGEHDNPPYIDPKYGAYDPANFAGTPPYHIGDHYYYYDIPAPGTSSVYGIPAYFPYTFSKPWEAAVFPPADLGGYGGWPDTFAFGYEIISEINTSLIENRLQFRFGRMRRDWGPEGNGSSLFMNAQARPFVAVEGTADPIEWMHFSFLTGALEYQKYNNQWEDADPFQNLFSLAMLEFNTKKRWHIDFGSATVWPKRFDLGYLFPVNSNFFYQNNVGDFDNLALFGNLEFRLPGKAKFWASLYVDEINLMESPFLNLDREMYAYQGGIKVNVAWLPFASVVLKYTKIEPYCYTHEYTETPWNRVPQDTSYVNNGESLGYYLPPNSDELLLGLDSMPLPGLRAHIQYQMVRHGADFGYGWVDGSSQNDKMPRKNANTTKYFLKDGVYQWNHAIKLGAAYNFKAQKLPLSVFAETGIVITRYTINGDAGIGNEGDYEALDDAVYRAGAGFILSVGVKIFP
ncbi:MAG: capsule assembly Wzi family protein [Treponema sp.]|jgi:hypothetical protein|nr:capsule assembly Wzi family protein [Treponema sp.]